MRTSLAPSIVRHYFLVVFLILGMSSRGNSQTKSQLTERIQEVISRPEFAHANFGIEFYALDSNEVVYSLNGKKLFVPASTTKLLTEGALLAALGADYRFHTRIYKTGSVDSKGTLRGDIVLVASGDPNLSNRIQPDGTLAFMNHDHSYGGPTLLGDPLVVVRQLADQVSAKGVRHVAGRVLVDATLFGDSPWLSEGGEGLVFSSIVINDNLIDLVMTPGVKINDPVLLDSTPKTAYIKFRNNLRTLASDAHFNLDPPKIQTNRDGTILVTLDGGVPLGSSPRFAPFFVPSPTRFAAIVMREALESAGITVSLTDDTSATDFSSYKRFYLPANQVAEHISPPLSEEVKVTLKVSQNAHAFMGPYLLGALLAKNATNPELAGFEVERRFLVGTKLDLSEASQGDGAGGSWADLFSPDFMCRYLAYWATRPDYPIFLSALPIMAEDGTLADIQMNSPAAGHVFAKTGEFDSQDKLNGRLMLNSRSLAGYVSTSGGKWLAFAAFVNHVPMTNDPQVAAHILLEALGEIAAAAYDAPLENTEQEGLNDNHK